MPLPPLRQSYGPRPFFAHSTNPFFFSRRIYQHRAFYTLAHSWPAILQTILRALLSAHAGIWFMAILSGTIAYALRNRALQNYRNERNHRIFLSLPSLGRTPFNFLAGRKTDHAVRLRRGIIAIGVFVAEHKRSRSSIHSRRVVK